MIGKQEDNPISCSSKDSSRANRAVWTENRPKKGQYMGTPLDQTDEYTTLREISSVVTVTKSVTIATNPSNKLPLAVTTLIAVEEVNSGSLGFHKSWGSYLDK